MGTAKGSITTYYFPGQLEDGEPVFKRYVHSMWNGKYGGLADIFQSSEHGAKLQLYMQWTSMEPAGGVMNRLWCGRSSDSDGWSLHIARPEQHAGPRHSTAPIGVWRETPAGRDWTGSTAET